MLLGLGAAALFAADVNGKWVGQVPGRDGQVRQVTFEFKAEGNQLTGSVTAPRGKADISEGKIDGDDISFVQVMQFDGNQVRLLYKGKVAGDEIKFTRQREGAERSQEFTAKRGN